MTRALGRYELVRHLAQGGMGDVWLAQTSGAAGFSKRVVVKTLIESLSQDAQFVERFVEEGHLLRLLDHPNIAQVLDLGEASGRWFIVMEHVDGFNLRELLDRRQRPALDEAASLCVLLGVAKALEHASTREDAQGQNLGLVHHDVSPSNVMVRRDGLVKLVDFGVARVTRNAPVTVTGLRGKLSYMAPEQLRDPGHADRRVDLFALGLIALELLTGRKALNVISPDSLEVAWGALEPLVTSLPVASETRTLIRDLVALSADDRPVDAGEVVQRIGARLLQLQVSDVQRPVAHSFEASFDALERRSASFDQNLSAGLIPAMSGQRNGPDATMSLPGAQISSQVDPADADSTSTSASAPELHADRPSTGGLRLFAVGLLFVGFLLISLWWRSQTPRQGDQAVTSSVRTTADSSERARAGEGADQVAKVPRSPPTDPAITVKASTARPMPAASRAGARQALGGAADPGKGPSTSSDAQHAGEASPRGEIRSTAPAPARVRRGVKSEPATLGELMFRVLPADARVWVDGAEVRGSGGVFRLRLPSGAHTVTVQDRHTGRRVSRRETVRSGTLSKVPGFSVVGGL